MWQYSTLDDMEIGSQIVVNHGGKDAIVYKTGAGDYKLVSNGEIYLFSDNGTNGGLETLNQMISIEEGSKPTMTVQDSSIGITGLDGTSKAQFDRFAGKAQRDYYTDEYMNTDEFASYVSEKEYSLETLHKLLYSNYDKNYTFNNESVDRNIVIDYGINRPNVSDTKIEKESGDFHVNYRELIESIDISLNMLEKSKMLKMLLDDYKASNGQGVDYSNLVGDNVDNIVTDASFFTNIDTVLKDEEFDKTFGVIEDLDKHLGGFLDAISACSFETNQLLNLYLNKIVKSKYNSIQERSTEDINAIMVDQILHNYIGITEINASEEELKSLAYLLEKFHPGEYSEFISSFDKRSDFQKFMDGLPFALEMSARVVVPEIYKLLYDEDYKKAVIDAASENLVYGIHQSYEDFADGVFGVTMTYYQVKSDLGGENDFTSKIIPEVLRFFIAQDFAKEEFEERTKDIDPILLNSIYSRLGKGLGEKVVTGGSKVLLSSTGIPKPIVAVLTAPFESGKNIQLYAKDSNLTTRQVSYLGGVETLYSVGTSVMSEAIPNNTFTTNIFLTTINGACNQVKEQIIGYIKDPEKYNLNNNIDIIDNTDVNKVFSSIPSDSLKWGISYRKDKYKESIINKYGSYTNFLKHFINN